MYWKRLEADRPSNSLFVCGASEEYKNFTTAHITARGAAFSESCVEGTKSSILSFLTSRPDNFFWHLKAISLQRN